MPFFDYHSNKWIWMIAMIVTFLLPAATATAAKVYTTV
jgi:hypothetical protein